MVHLIPPLPLDSPRWAELGTRMGHEGERVRDALRALSADPSDEPVFTKMWPTICSEGTTYDAAFAAAPYLVALARRMSGDEALKYLIVLGLITTHAAEVPDDLEPAYRQALSDALALLLDRLADCPIDHTLRCLLAAVAAFRGRTDVGEALQGLDAVAADELQKVIERDQKEAST